MKNDDIVQDLHEWAVWYQTDGRALGYPHSSTMVSVRESAMSNVSTFKTAGGKETRPATHSDPTLYAASRAERMIRLTNEIMDLDQTTRRLIVARYVLYPSHGWARLSALFQAPRQTLSDRLDKAHRALDVALGRKYLVSAA